MTTNRNDFCPCGSGKKYKKCCLEADERVLIPIDEKTKEILDRENERFKSIMGRDIGLEDPIMPSSLKMSEDEYKEHVTAMLREIDVDEAIIYAFNKLGFVVGETNEHLVTSTRKRQWNEAINEYYESLEEEEDEEMLILDELFGSLALKLEKLLMVYSLILRKHSLDAETIRLTGDINLNDYIIFCLTKNLKSIKAIIVLLENFVEDALNLSRTNFENYLEIVQAKYDAEFLKKTIEFQNGIDEGGYSRKGKYLIKESTGERIKPLNNYEKANLNRFFAEEDTAVYEYLYNYLSSFTHLDLKTAGNYIHQELGFSAVLRNDNRHCTIILLFINFMLLHELKDLELMKIYKSDIVQLRDEIGNIFHQLEQNHIKLPLEISKRLRKTMQPYS
jgi:hypothetical protein